MLADGPALSVCNLQLSHILHGTSPNLHWRTCPRWGRPSVTW